MKLNLVSKRSGFTLIEILICIAILAMLSVVLLGVRSYITNKKLSSTAQNQVAQLESCMNAYRADNSGILPDGTGDEASSNVMYTALYRDADNDGQPDKEDGVELPPYCTTFSIIKDTKSKEILDGIPVIKKQIRTKDGRKKRFVILDPWGNPYRYRLGFEQEDSKGKAGKGFNPDFDIFSLGGDALGDGKSKDGDNADNVTNIRSYK
ncbi:MAG: type II secretion system protein [Akkermansia sp.]|nr:type II secretion system protein [Akkermansia sp.]